MDMDTLEQAERTEYVFPDEQLAPETRTAKAEPEEIRVEVVDDTPRVDRGRKPSDPPADPTDAELSQYSEVVQKRIQHFTKGYHDERRAKEAANREKEAAFQLAKTLVDENKRLQGSLSEGQQALLENAKRIVAQELTDAKRALKEAQDSFDTDAIVEAQQKMFDAQIKTERVKNYRPTPLQGTDNGVQTQRQPQNTPQAAPVADPKAQKWLEDNSWFGEDEEKSSFAMGVHNKLVKNGVDPTSDEYYEKLNSRMREVFSDLDESGGQVGVRKQSNVVASAKRSTAPKRIVLTQSQVSLAKRLGLTNEQYARQVAAEMRN